MNIVTDPDLLNQLNAADPNAPATGGAPAGGGAPPLTIQGPGNVTDPALINALNNAPDDPPPPQPAAPSTWKDMARGFGSGLVKGAAAVPGMLGDLASGGEYATSWALAKGADKLGLLPPGKTADDFLNDVKAMNLQAPGGTLGAITNATSLPTTQSTLGAIQGVAGQPLPKPQTPAGQATENITSFVPAALAGSAEATGAGQVLRNVAAYGVAPGVTSEAAGQTANSMLGSWADTPARIIGGGLGGSVGHLAVAPTSADHILSGATRGISDDDMASAQALQQSAATQGISITPAEAIQQVTGGRSSLANVQRHLEGTTESAPIMAQYFSQRPQQIRNAASDVFGQIAPYPTSPSGIGTATQKEATGAMSAIWQERSDATAPYYQDAQNDQVPAGRMQAVAQQLDALIAQHPNNPQLTGPLTDLRSQIVDQPSSAGTPGTPAVPGQRMPVTDPNTGAVIRYQQQPGTPAVPGTPATPETYLQSVPQLDQIYGGLRDQYTGPAPLGQSGTDARAGRLAGQGLGLLNSALTDSSPSLAAGRQAHAIMTDQFVAPREAGPVGQISQTNDLGTQGRALYPTNPNVGSRYETQEAVQRLPSSAGPITRNHLETAFNEANQSNIPGPNQWGGAKFAAQTFGNPQQAQNLYAGLGALPNGSQLTPRVQSLVEALQATGQRQPIGSKTAYNTELNETMGEGRPLGTALSLAASPVKAAEFAREWYEKRQVGSNAEALAHAMTAGNFDALASARAAVSPEQYRGLLARALSGQTMMALPVAAQNRTRPGL